MRRKKQSGVAHSDGAQESNTKAAQAQPVPVNSMIRNVDQPLTDVLLRYWPLLLAALGAVAYFFNAVANVRAEITKSKDELNGRISKLDIDLASLRTRMDQHSAYNNGQVPGVSEAEKKKVQDEQLFKKDDAKILPSPNGGEPKPVVDIEKDPAFRNATKRVIRQVQTFNSGVPSAQSSSHIRVMFRLNIDGKGIITQLTTDPPNPLHAQAMACLNARLKDIPFPHPQSADYVVEIPLNVYIFE